MPNSFMHHVTINGTNFEIEDKQSREVITDDLNVETIFSDKIVVNNTTKAAFRVHVNLEPGFYRLRVKDFYDFNGIIVELYSRPTLNTSDRVCSIYTNDNREGNVSIDFQVNNVVAADNLYLTIYESGSFRESHNSNAYVIFQKVLSPTTLKSLSDDITSLNTLIGTFCPHLEPGSISKDSETDHIRKDPNTTYMVQRGSTPIGRPMYLYTGDTIETIEEIPYVTYTLCAFYENEDGTKSTSGWVNSFEMPNDGYCWIVVRRSNNAKTAVQELSSHVIIRRKSHAYLKSENDSIKETINNNDNSIRKAIKNITGVEYVTSSSYAHSESETGYRPLARAPFRPTNGKYIIYIENASGFGTYYGKFFKANTLNTSDVVISLINSTNANGVYVLDIGNEEAASIINFTLYSGNNSATSEATADISIYRIGDGFINNIENTLPEYYKQNDWLKNKIDSINEYSAFTNGIVLPFITDLHFYANSKNSKLLLKEVLEHTASSIVLFGGDYTPAYGSSYLLQQSVDNLLDYFGYLGHDKCFSVMGNHDLHITASSTDSTKKTYTWGKTYNTIFRSSERWTIANSTAGGYYCIDNNAQKTRIIMLNSSQPASSDYTSLPSGDCLIGSDQALWLIDVLKEKTAYKIIVVSHIPSDPDMPSYSSGMSNVQLLLEAFVNKTSGSFEYGTYDFTTVTSELVAHINGHCHSDDSHVSNGVLSISTTCDAHYKDDGFDAEVGSVTEQAFDVYCINYDAKTINTIRVGRGNNRNWTY